ncbi:VirD4-like conjugal transfer protein, CD1115 family [Sporosarcina sp. BP05]|uniref:VirD4-like conjugal transfer protein, CD1115 family n=1 Tax=Sporosarcina sp. BP05 TaxID=2758726 RepID=UPI001645DF36|nr:type IV secretory system conjugative DNA transfer family protein [Sporosarcina sp. BP05]
MDKLKKGWLAITLIMFLSSLAFSYVLLAYLYKFMSKKEFTETLQMPKEVFNSFYMNEDYKIMVILIPLVIFMVLMYAMRKSIFVHEYSDASAFGVKGNAKFGNPDKIMNDKVLVSNQKYGSLKKTMNLTDGIILGIAPDTKNILVVGDKTSLATKNIFINGSSGAGKGQAYVLNNIINNKNESIIVIDPKGENFSLTAQLKIDQGYKVYNVDFRNFEYSRYNPLDYVRNDEDAQKISSIITSNSGADESFFTERASKLLAALISYVKSEFPAEQANMAKVQEVYQEHVTDMKKCNVWLEEMSDSQPSKKLMQSVLSTLTSENTRASVLSSFDSITSIFNFNRIKKMTETSDFKFNDFVEEKAIIYVKISAPTNPYKALTSVFIGQMIDEFFAIGDKDPLGRLKTPVHFLLDEFPNIGRVDGYQETLALCRGYRMYMHTIVQNITQLEEKKLYGKEQTQSILSNHSVKLILKVGEQQSAEYWSKWFGKTTISYTAKSSSQSKNGKTTSTNTQYESKDLVTPDDLMQLDDDKAYLLLAGLPPLYINKAWQYLVYPNLLTDKNRELNYLNIRNSLGYTDEPMNFEGAIDDGLVNIFENYRSDLAIEKEKKQEKLNVAAVETISNQLDEIEAIYNSLDVQEEAPVESDVQEEAPVESDVQEEAPVESDVQEEAPVKSDVQEEKKEESLEDLLKF